MRTGIAAAVSIVGVLAAGSAAALVNTQVFDNTPSESGASAAVLPPPSTVEVSIPAVTVPPSTLVPVTTATTSTTSPAAERPTGMLTRFEVGEAGSVTVDVIEGRLVFVGAEAGSGWTVAERPGRERDDDEIDVVFESPTVRVEFEAELIGGEIVPTVESESLVASPAAPGASAPPTAPHDDENDHLDGDHDDEDEHDDEDDHDEEDEHDEDEEDDRDD